MKMGSSQRVAPVLIAVAIVGALSVGAVAALARGQDSPRVRTRDLPLVAPGRGVLDGTLVLPPGRGPFPIVVLLAGSGPSDIDGTIGLHRVLRDIADGLAVRGIASYRYEKRARAHPDEFRDRDYTVEDEYVADALNAIALVRRTSNLDHDRVVLLAHSQAASVAPRIAEKSPDLAGLILLAPSTEPIEDAIVRQAAISTAALPRAEARKQVEQLTSEAEKVKTIVATRSTGGHAFGIPASYWLDLAGYRAADRAASLKVPILLLGANNDYLVLPASFSEFEAALSSHENAVIHRYDGLTHSFVRGPATADAFSRPGHVDHEVVRDIAVWIRTSRDH